MKSAETYFHTNSITTVTQNLLCCGCGACAAICKRQAISLTETVSGYLVATVDSVKCVNCGACLNVCPGYERNQTIESFDCMQGTYLSAYVGHADDPQIRCASQSGGVVTALLIYLLEKGEIKGAFVNAFDSKMNRPKVVFAQTREQILASAGSYYAQSSVTNAVLEQHEQECAAVMLGCQAESLFLADCQSSLVSKPKYIIGLVCAGQNSGLNIDYLLKAAGCKHKQLERFRYKSKEVGGWPGNVVFVSHNKRFSVSKDIRLLSKDIFGTYRCDLCYDKANIYSDIVCGDPWGLAEYEESQGNTIVLIRNQNGQQLITNAINDGVLRLSPLKTDDFFKSLRLRDIVFDKFRQNCRCIAEQGYALPYKVSDNILRSDSCVSTEVQKKMAFRRAFYSCSSAISVAKMIRKKHCEILVKLFQIRRKRAERLVCRLVHKLRGV